MSEKVTKKGRPAQADIGDGQDDGGLRGQLEAAYADRADTPAASAAPAPVKSQDSGPAAPASWKAEAKAHWSGLPPELKQYLSGRERDIERGFSRFDEDRMLEPDLRLLLQRIRAQAWSLYE